MTSNCFSSSLISAFSSSIVFSIFSKCCFGALTIKAPRRGSGMYEPMPCITVDSARAISATFALPILYVLMIGVFSPSVSISAISFWIAGSLSFGASKKKLYAPAGITLICCFICADTSRRRPVVNNCVIMLWTWPAETYFGVILTRSSPFSAYSPSIFRASFSISSYSFLGALTSRLFVTISGQICTSRNSRFCRCLLPLCLRLKKLWTVEATSDASANSIGIHLMSSESSFSSTSICWTISSTCFITSSGANTTSLF